MGDLNQYQAAQKVAVVDGDSQAVVTNATPSGSEEGLVVRNVPSGTQAVAGTITNVPSGTQAVAGTVTIGSGTIATNADANVAAGTAPSKVLVGGLIYNTTAPAPTNGQSVAMQCDDHGNQKVSAAVVTDFIYNAGLALTPKFAAFGAASSGDNTLIALVSSKKLRVLAMMGVASVAMNIYFTSNAGGTVIFGGSTNKIQLAANSGFVLSFNPVGWFETTAGHNLICNLSAANAFSGGITYVEV